MNDYLKFLESKRLTIPDSGFEPYPIKSPLYDFQAAITKWAIRKGKVCIWADCGLGKTPIALEWCRQVCKKTNKPVLILTPLAVAHQFVEEGNKFGIVVKLCREYSDIENTGIHVTNYDRIDHFNTDQFIGICLDESSVLKDYNSTTRNLIIESFAETPYKLACTATPAPNDFIELGNHAEFIGAMSRTEMLSMFFVHDGGETQKWRLKGHAKQDFWKWVSTWAVALKKPSDIGFNDNRFNLPPLNIHEQEVHLGNDFANSRGMLFVDAQTLEDQRAVRRESLPKRVSIAAEMINASSEPWIVWCDLNTESQELTKSIPDSVEVTGSDSIEEKESRIWSFLKGHKRVLVSKPSICGWGLNMQHCHNVAFVGITHSFEQWYQAIRRSWRFGQTSPVECHIIISDADHAVLSNLRRKQREAEEMIIGMVHNMSDLSKPELKKTSRTFTGYDPKINMIIPDWLKSERGINESPQSDHY